jgi:hypothetical protein
VVHRGRRQVIHHFRCGLVAPPGRSAPGRNRDVVISGPIGITAWRSFRTRGPGFERSLSDVARSTIWCGHARAGPVDALGPDTQRVVPSLRDRRPIRRVDRAARTPSRRPACARRAS